MKKNRYKPDQMRYKPNLTSFYLCLLAIVFNILFFINLYKSTTLKPDFIIGLDVFCNVIFMLFMFLASVKSKSYITFWSYLIYGFALFQVVRIIFVPLRFNNLGQLTHSEFIITVLFLSLSAITLIFSGIINHLKGNILKKYLSEIKCSEEKNNGRH